MKAMIKIVTSTFLTIYATSALSTDIFYADKQFTQHNYVKALSAYKKATEVGNPHAYYQLGRMYLQGLGTEANILDSIAFYSLAAEQDFHKAQMILDQIINELPVESHPKILLFIEEISQKYSYSIIRAKYFPVIKFSLLDDKIMFDGKDSLQTVFHPEDIDLESLETSNSASFSFDDEDSDFGGVDDPFGTVLTQQTTPFLIIDHDIKKDGSIHNVNDVQKFGLHMNLLNEFKLFPLAKPEFQNQPTEFPSRSYLGAASFSKFTMLRENERMYRTIVKKKQFFAKQNTLNDQFNLAMLLLNFPWLGQDEYDAESLLLTLAEQGHSPAMYEYGMKLYREQRKLDQAIEWISEASKYGLSRAEYRLGTILESSPWVENDEKKALFWYTSAFEKNNTSAGIRATRLLLNAAEPSLHNVDLAVEFLERLEETELNNPEFYFLKALVHRKDKYRDISLTVRYLRDAIFKAQIANWETNDWEELLNRITQGTIYVTDE